MVTCCSKHLTTFTVVEDDGTLSSGGDSTNESNGYIINISILLLSILLLN